MFSFFPFSVQLRILCLDVLGDSVANCFAAQKRKHSRRAPNDTSRSSVSTSIETTAGTSSDSSGKGNEDWLVPLVLFLIEGLAAFEPRAFSFHQFHAEKLHGISQKDFEKTRVSLSQTGRAAKILKDIVRTHHSVCLLWRLFSHLPFFPLYTFS